MMQYTKFGPILSSTPLSKYNSVWRSLTTEAIAARVDIPEKSWEEIPGPSSLPLIGPLLHFLPGGSLYNLNGLAFTQKIYNTYGPIARLDSGFGIPKTTFLFDAESSAQILRAENRIPYRPGFESLQYYRHHHKKNVTPNTPTGLLTDHGEVWKDFRSTVNPIFMLPKIMKLYVNSFDGVALDMIARLKAIRGDNNQLQSSLDKEMDLWALESIAVVALGTRLNSLDLNLPSDSPAKKLIETIHNLFVVVDELDFKINFWRVVSTPTFKKAMKLFEDLDLLTKHFIDKTKEELKIKQKSDDERGVLEKLLAKSEEHAHIMVSDMFFAGVDTMSNSIILTLYLLAINPEKQEKLRAEILSKNEKKPYLKACLKESLRMMPIAAENMRVTTKEYEVLGYKIPSDMYVVFAHHDMSLMEEHFPRSKEFLPERWLVEKDDPLHYRNAHPFAYAPFGFGVRSCIGRRIAELELETFLARLMENFRVEWFGPPIKVHATSLNFVKPPFNFIFKDV